MINVVTSPWLRSLSCKQYLKLWALAIVVAGVFISLTGCGGAPTANANSASSVGNANAGSQSNASNSSASQNAPAQQPSNAPDPPPPSAPPPPPNQKTVAAIQSLGGWQWCTAKLNGQTCASGLGQAQSSVTPHQQTPSLSGESSVFWIGGDTPYSNALWWKEIGPDAKPTHFNYDLFFYLEDPTAPEALEFDVNQTISGTRYVWGTECSYRNTGYWQIWDTAAGKWFNTDVPCPQVSARQWHHLVWQFERVGNKAHYIGVTLDGKYTVVDKYFDPQQYGSKGISVAFQLDGDYRQTAYKVWIDKMNLISW